MIMIMTTLCENKLSDLLASGLAVVPDVVGGAAVVVTVVVDSGSVK